MLARAEAPWQWQVVRADLDPAEGSEQAGVRPVLVVSRESVNTVLPVITIVTLTTRKNARRIYPTEALVPSGEGGLPSESIALAHQIRTISKNRVLGSYGWIENEIVREAVRESIRIHLDLS